MCRKELQERQTQKEKQVKEMRVEIRKKANNMSKMVQVFWKSVEKVVQHNYNQMYEKQRQQQRAKRLERFVSKHLKLSFKVAEQLNTNQFVQQSMYKEDGKQVEQINASDPIVKIYSSQDVIDTSQIKGGQLESNKGAILDNSANKESDQQIVSSTMIAEQTVQMAESFQPKGFTLDNAVVNTKVPFLLRGQLREYQIIGLDWLITLHNKKLNGILADEMGLGKTIQTISMIASLACDKGVWGPHLIVVPTTIIINWEMEFKRWCPALKILTYFGSQKERKIKRQGWSKDNSFHVCITSYKLVIQDHFAFRRKKWYYMVLDEAQNIKNFKSQRWQTLLRFNTKRRLLLTGTPLQNDVMELWSLMHFLMPNIFSNQQDFKEWFSNPFSQSINHNQSLNIGVVQKLQSILRPFLLRRIKREVEKQLPEKVEHIVQCNLSRRQRLLYDEYINSDKTKDTLSQSDFFSIMNVLMQLRKVCNHPDLFEPRSIESPFILTDQDRIKYHFSSFMYKSLVQYNPMKDVNFKGLNFILSEFESQTKFEYQQLQSLYPKRPLIEVIAEQSFDNIDNLSATLINQRPQLLEGQAIGRKLHFNSNLLMTPNTDPLTSQSLQHTLPQDSKFYHSIPTYLNSACLPFSHQYYSLPSLNHLRHASKQQDFSALQHYKSSLQNYECKQKLDRLTMKLIQWRNADHRNRFNILCTGGNNGPVYGKDLREAVKVSLVFNEEIVSSKKHRYVKRGEQGISTNQYVVPSAVFNVFGRRARPEEVEPQQRVEDWEDYSEEQIEVYNQRSLLIKEVSKTQQIKSKKKKLEMLRKQQQLQQQEAMEKEKERQRLIELQQQELRQKMIEEQKQKAMEQQHLNKKFNLIITINQPNEETDVNQEEKKDESMEVDTEKPQEQPSEKFDNKNVTIDVVTPDLNQFLPSELQQQNQIDEKDQSQPNQTQPETLLIGKLQEQNHNDPYSKLYMNTSKRYINRLQELTSHHSEKQEFMRQQQRQQQIYEEEMRDVQDLERQLQQKLENEGKINVIQPSSQDKIEESEKQQEISKEEPKDANMEDQDDTQQQQNVDDNNNKNQSQNNEVQQVPDDNKLSENKNDEVEEKGDIKEQEPDKDNDKENEQEDVKMDQDKQKESVLTITYKNSDYLKDFIVTPLQRIASMDETVKQFKFIIPKVVSKPVEFIPSKIFTAHQKEQAFQKFTYQKLMAHKNVNQSLKHSNILFFPHKNLVQYDCGKLQKLAQLLKQLYNKGSKVLIFTQMTRMLDILENFLNLHGYIYVRLDGSVKVENRQKMVDKFNHNSKIFCFISSTRCGGIGINLTGADCVIFYDTDWNPAMDKQAQDRCHRIGQTKTVHIYRLISINTIEENIFKKSLQKREIGGLIIEGNFDAEFFSKVSIKDILEDNNALKSILGQTKVRQNVIKEDNIQFHSNLEDQGNSNSGTNNEIDYEKQREIELYRRRFEEALVRIEDQEDVDAFQEAKKEIDDEFDVEDQNQFQNQNEEAANQDTENIKDAGAMQDDGKQAQGAQQNNPLDKKSAVGLSRDIKKHEMIDWKNNENLNLVTKRCIENYENKYSFDDFMADKSKKDSTIQHNQSSSKTNQDNEDNNSQDNKSASGDDKSEFDLSEEEEAEHPTQVTWNRQDAESLYTKTRDEIENKYFMY